MVVWEVIAVDVPYKDKAPITVAHEVAYNKTSLALPAHCLPELVDTCNSCLKHDSAERPSFEDLLGPLENLVQAYAPAKNAPGM